MEHDWERVGDEVPWPEAIVRAVADEVAPDPGAVTRLSGGLANVNWRVETGAGPVIVRAWTRDPAAADLECALLAEVADRVPVPRVLHRSVVAGAPVAVLSWMPGQPLAAARSALAAADARRLFAEAGRLLRAVQDQGYEACGHLGLRGDQVDVVQPLGTVAEACRGYLAHVLFVQGGGQVLGQDRLARLWSAFATHGEILDTEREVVLCHADYKPENLLVAEGPRGWRITAVLDWEFAWASSPWFDAGQLLRWEHAWPDGIADAFADGWQRHPGERPDDWRHRARLLDLMNLGGFLCRVEGRPTMRRDVIALIDRSLDHL